MTCCLFTATETVKSFMESYKESIEQDDSLNSLFRMSYVGFGMGILDLYIRGLLFNESDLYAPLDIMLPLTRAERVEPARNFSRDVMQTFRSSMQRIPLDDIKSERLRQYFEAMGSFLNELYAEVEKAMDDAVTKLSNGTAPSYHRQLCTAKIVDEQIGCEFKKAAQVFVTSCHQPEPSLVPMMPNNCGNESDSGLLSSCVLDEALGALTDFGQLFKTSDILRIRLVHLVFVDTLCKGQWLHSAQLKALPEAVEASFQAVFANGKQKKQAEEHEKKQQMLKSWPQASVETTKALAEETGPHGYPTEGEAGKYDELAKQIAAKIDVQWKEYEDSPLQHEAFVYYKCDDCEMMTDDKWINLEATEQRAPHWWTGERKTRLGTAKHAGVNIVLACKSGRRECGKVSAELSAVDWINENSKVISNTVSNANNTAALLAVLDQELSPPDGKPWRASDGGCFRAMLAIRCAYKFVWLELAWKYYPATSDASYKVDVFNGSFNSRCTRVAFIQ